MKRLMYSPVLVRAFVLLVSLAVISPPLHAQFIAFNDHAPGAGTSTNATTWDVFGAGAGSTGALRDIKTGANLPVTLTITRSASGVSAAGTQGSPAPGTPLYNAFNGYVDFQGTPNPSVELATGGMVTYTFTGLNPNKRYSFMGSAVRGNAPYTDRWTLFEIVGAGSFASAHTTNALTSATIPSLTDSQAAINTGVNNTSSTGDMVVWEDIAPDATGSFAVTCQQYIGPVPGGSSAGTKGYGMTGIRLQEFDVAHVPAAIVTDPQSQAVDELQPVTFTAAVAGNPGPTLQWYRNGVAIKDATNLSYTISAAQLSDDGATFKITAANTVSNVNYTATSAAATLTVNADTNAPSVVDSRAIGVVQVKVIFSEPVLATDATNLANYSITGPNGAVQVSAANLESPSAVILDVATLTENVPYTLTVSGIRDQAAAGNMLATTQRTFAAVTYAPLDIGKPAKAGTIAAVSGGYNVSGAGADIGGTRDQFQFAYQARSGDFDIRVRVADVTVTDPYVKAGLMVRDALQDTSRFAAVFASSAQLGSFFEGRATVGGTAGLQGPTLKFPANYPWAWLRLRRSGTNFFGYGSFDGAAWQQLGTVNIAMTNDVFFGLAVTSGNTNAIATAKFRDIGPVTNPATFTYVPTREWIGPSNRRTGLLFSEIMYHSRPRLDGRSSDFIELYNGEPIFQDLTGWRVTGGIDFQFPDGFQIQAGQFVVIAADPDAVAEQYGISGVLGPFTKKLSNTSDTLKLLNASGATRAELTYRSDAPWPISPDGFGHSLVCLKPSYGEDDVRAWGQSQLIGGSPGYDDPIVANPWAGVVINEILAVPELGTNGFVEIFNASDATIDVSGCVLTDGTNSFAIPDGSLMNGRSWLTFTRAQMKFGPDAQGGTLALVAPDNSRVLDAIRIAAQEPGVSVGRTPDGVGALRRLGNPSLGANDGLRQEDIVINELMYAPITKEADDQYIELYNRGGAAIDLGGWKFVEGIDFTFPSGVSIPPNGYLVVARNVARILTNYSNLTTNNTVGNFGGKFSGSGERVALAKPVGTNLVVVSDFTYGTGGRWPEQADGGGSSLELRDVNSDPTLAPNWAASDETQKGSWATYEITAQLNNANQTYAASKFFVMCVDSGEYLLDDFEVSRNGTNYVTNPGLESGATGWNFYGSHSGTTVDTGGAVSGNNCLHVRSLEAGDEGPNSVRGSLSTTLVSGTTYTIRVKARWLTGWPELLVRIRGNGIELPIALQIPKNLGTPGLPNSKRVGNAGPAITDVTHYPPIPAANQAVVVTARIADPNGVAIPQLIVRPDPATTNFVVSMHDDGQNGDRLAGDGIYSGTIPGRASGTVAFTIRVADNASSPASSAFPSDAPTRECIIRWNDPSPFGSLANYHLWSTAASANGVSRSGLERTYYDCTVIYDMRTIYNVGWRNKGSPFHNGVGSYSTSYADDDLLLGNGRHVFRSTGNGGAEGTQMADDVAYWIGEKLGVPFNHGRYMRLYRNGGLHYPVDLDLEVPDRGMAKDWFGGGGLDDTLYKIAGWFEFDDSNANGTASVSWATIQRHLSGNNLKPAAYRFNFVSHPGGKSGLDLTFLLNIVNAANSSDRVNQLSNLADMEQWMRVLGHRRVVGDWDSWSYRTGQNMYMYAPLGQRATLMSWDMDFVLGVSGADGAGTDNLFSAGEDPVVQTMMAVPAFQRMLWRAYQDAVNGPLVKTVSDPQFDSRRSVLLKNNVSSADPGGLKSYVASERSYLLSRIRTADATSFAITTPSTNTADATITITGLAPFGVATIEINGVPYPVTWTTARAWSVRVPLGAATNVLNFVGKDLRGNIYTNATGQITVTYTGPIPDPKDWVVINEVMYNAATNNAEYIELYNSHPSYAFDLSGFKLKGASFTFPNGTFIQTNGYALIVKDSAAFAQAYGNTIPVVGQYSGKLANSGDILTLVKPGPAPGQETVIDQVRYENRYPWDPAANGGGFSLQLRDPAQDNWRPANWATANAPGAATPGRINAVRSTLDPFPAIWINEVLPNNSGSVVDGQGQHDPWIELYNAGADPIDLSVFYLSNDPNSPTQWLFPADTSIAPGAYMLIWADGQPEQSTDTELHTNFRLDPTNGIVALNRLQGNAPATVDYVYFTVASPDLSYGGTLNGVPQLQHLLYVATPGGSNDPESLHPDIAVNEWMASNISIIKDPADGRYDDWFELYNGGAAPVNLENYVLSDSLTDIAMFRIPHGYSIPAHGYLMAWADNETNENTSVSTDLHVPFKLSKSGESIALFSPNGAIVDAITFGAQNDNFSGGRYPDGADAIYTFTKATPGAANLAPIGLAARFSQVTSDGAQLTLSWSTITGHSYRIEAKSDLNAPSWTAVGNDLTANSASVTATIDLSATGNRIFRVVTLN